MKAGHPTSSRARAPRRADAQGFTLVEVVIALAVGALLISAIASAMVSALRAETSARLQHRACELLQSLQTEAWLTAGTQQPMTNFPPDWVSATEDVEQGEGTNLVCWTVWKISPLRRPALSATLCRQEQNSQVR